MHLQSAKSKITKKKKVEKILAAISHSIMITTTIGQIVKNENETKENKAREKKTARRNQLSSEIFSEEDARPGDGDSSVS